MKIDEFEFRNKQGQEIEPTKNQLVVYIKSLHKKIKVLQEALELACETIKQMCGKPLWIGGNIPSPEPKDSKYFKDIAMRMLENE